MIGDKAKARMNEFVAQNVSGPSRNATIVGGIAIVIAVIALVVAVSGKAS
jgi:hypothetical protein